MLALLCAAKPSPGAPPIRLFPAENHFLFPRAARLPVEPSSGRLPLTMAKLLPLLTSAAMIGVIGGVLLWLIVAHRRSPDFEIGRDPIPAGTVRGDSAEPGESQSSSDSSNPGTKLA